MYNYIPHPSNLGKSSMITTLLIEEGHAAYGVYWLVLELLRDCQDYKIGDNPKAISWSIHCQDVELVSRVLHNYGLFDKDSNGLLFSPWLCEQMAAYDDRKRKLQEAGRRGAAKRFGSFTPAGGQAIATPSSEDGQAIAHNITQSDITSHDVMLSNTSIAQEWKDICRNQGKAIDPLELENIAKEQKPGHANGYILQCCLQYGMGKNVYFALCSLTDDADVSHPIYKKFVALVKRIQAEKYRPEYPANFFFSKLLANK